VSFKFGLIVADTSRSLIYLATLARFRVFPNSILVLGSNREIFLKDRIFDFSDAYSSAWRRHFPDIESNPTLGIMDLVSLMGCSDVVCLEQNDVNSPEVIEWIEQRRLALSCCVYSGYAGVIVEKAVLDQGLLFLHAHSGFLPDYKGSTTTYYSLLETNLVGVSVIGLSPVLDAGEIFVRKWFYLERDERFCIDHFYDAYTRALALIDVLRDFKLQGSVGQGVEQESGGTMYYVIHPLLKYFAIFRD